MVNKLSGVGIHHHHHHLHHHNHHRHREHHHHHHHHQHDDDHQVLRSGRRGRRDQGSNTSSSTPLDTVQVPIISSQHTYRCHCDGHQHHHLQLVIITISSSLQCKRIMTYHQRCLSDWRRSWCSRTRSWSSSGRSSTCARSRSNSCRYSELDVLQLLYIWENCIVSSQEVGEEKRGFALHGVKGDFAFFPSSLYHSYCPTNLAIHHCSTVSTKSASHRPL